MTTPTSAAAGGSRSAVRRLGATLLAAAVVVTAAAGAVTAFPARPASAAGIPEIDLVVPAHAETGDALQVQVVLRGAGAAAGFQAALRYDAARVQYAGLVPTTTRLSASATAQHPLTPVETTGGVVFGSWSCTSAACLAADHSATQHTQTLATLTVYPQAAGNLPLALGDIVVVDAAGHRLVTRVGATQVVRVGTGGSAATLPAGPVDGASDLGPLVRIPSALAATAPTTAAVGDVARSWSDVQATGNACGPTVPSDGDDNADGCLDIADVQAAAHLVRPVPAARPPLSTHAAAASPSASRASSAAPAAKAAGTTSNPTPNPNPGTATASNTKTFIVNTAADSDGTCTATVCSLRTAMKASNSYGNSSNPGPALITFNIPGGGLQTIQLASKLPTLTNPYGITFDARTQPGWTASTSRYTFDGTDMVAVVGNGYDTTSSSTSNFDGFFAQTPNNAWYGLDLYNFRKAIVLDSSSATGNGIYDDIVCTTGTGSFQADHVVAIGAGIVIGNSASYNQVGYAGPAYRNVVSGCAAKGVVINGPASYNQVQGSIFGLSPDTSKAVPNESHGSDNNYGLTYNTIGGLQAGQGNLFSGNDGEGVEISHNPANLYNKILGNFIGTDSTGTMAPSYAANGEHGVSLEGAPECSNCGSDAGFSEVANNIIVQNKLGGIIVDKGRHDDSIHDNKIGVTSNGTAAPNAYFGVAIEYETHRTLVANNEIGYERIGIGLSPYATRQTDTTDEGATDDNTFTQNSIHNSVGLGIDLWPYGSVNTTSNQDVDVNDGILAPTFTAATPVSLTATTCASCTVELFISDSTDQYAYGGSQSYVSTTTADANGTVSISIPKKLQGAILTATATDPAGSTSEFSRNLLVPTGSSGNQPPTAAATVSCTHLTCSFDGSGSTDPENQIASYAWTFGDGATGTGATVTHAYTTPGSYSAVLTVTDAQGATSTAMVTATPTNTAPVASGTVSCTNLHCTFDGSGSRDSDGTVASYAWDFGDGSTPGSGVGPTHDYASNGSYTATLTVTDNDGATGSTTVAVNVTVSPNGTDAQDGFTRTVKKGFGTADKGGAYSSNQASDLAVVGDHGTFTLSSNNTTRNATLAGLSEVNSDAYATFSFDKVPASGHGVQAGLEVRRQAQNSAYRGIVRVSGNTVYAGVSKYVGSSTETILGEQAVSGLSAAAGTAYRVHVAVSGLSPTTIAVTVFAAGSTEPTSAQVTVTDSEPTLQKAGSVGAITTLSAASGVNPVTVSIDDLLVNYTDIPPTAAFTPTCNGKKCTFDASASSDRDGSVASYSWSFGDGTTATGVAPSHRYSALGTYSVTLTVADNRGVTTTTSQSITLRNTPPTAAESVSCSGVTCQFDASGSSDPDGTVVSYQWSFGDSTSSASGSTPTTSHTYSGPGTYPVVLTVTDDDGATGTNTQNAVATAPNNPPTASFTGSCAGTQCSFDGRASSDSDGTVASYAWDFGDGSTGTGAQVTHTYSGTPAPAVTLTVTDNANATGAVKESVPAPSATSTCTALACSFDASATTDTGTVASTAWSFGDGTTGTGVTTSHTYATAGTYPVTVTVTDSDTISAGVTKNVAVAPTPTVPPGYGTDSFTRTVTSGWGTADSGGAWSLNQSSGFSVANGAGNISQGSSDAGREATLGTATQTDSDTTGTVTFDRAPTGYGFTVWLVGRRISSTAEYRGRLRIAPAGAYLALTDVSGSSTDQLIGSETLVSGLASSANAYRMRLQVVGTAPTTLRLKVWQLGQTEPTAWNLTGTDTTSALQAKGAVGVRVTSATSVTNGPVQIGIDDVASSSSHRSPTAAFTSSCTSLTCSFDGSGSSSPSGDTLTDGWSFGDGGATASGTPVSRTFPAAGSYPVTLEVTDAQGYTGVSTVTVTVSP